MNEVVAPPGDQTFQAMRRPGVTMVTAVLLPWGS
jgi:hypothetical protein